jgi:hypothetical protein
MDYKITADFTRNITIHYHNIPSGNYLLLTNHDLFYMSTVPTIISIKQYL